MSWTDDLAGTTIREVTQVDERKVRVDLEDGRSLMAVATFTDSRPADELGPPPEWLRFKLDVFMRGEPADISVTSNPAKGANP